MTFKEYHFNNAYYMLFGAFLYPSFDIHINLARNKGTKTQSEQKGFNVRKCSVKHPRTYMLL